MTTKPPLHDEFPTDEIHVEHNGYAWLVNSHIDAEHEFDRLSDAVSYAMDLRDRLPTVRLFVVLHCGAAPAVR
jgi:hypothetical protein